MSEDVVDMELDIPLDENIDLDFDPEQVAKELGLDIQNDSTFPPTTQPQQQDHNPEGTSSIYSLDDPNARPEAILLHGVDDMSTAEIKVYCQSTALSKVEWVDDSSCVLVFTNTDEAMQAALLLLQEPTSWPSSTLLPSKPFERPVPDNGDQPAQEENPLMPPVKPVIKSLSIRSAKLTDVKTKGSRERSRYYLFHGSDNSTVKKDHHPSVFDRLGPRRSSHRQRPYDRHDRRDRRRRNDGEEGGRRDDYGRHRHRSSRPRSDSASRNHLDDAKPVEIPEHLKQRLGSAVQDSQQPDPTSDPSS
ncbi:hypothetical protein DM01DRAFT_1404648 [Hesseltinella vesiculosa]|uniref:Uncharacterized protein n=1 Tax=Hesseltinella vesiculosa TaxID=101127 RepID=A0A1X2GS90_9FUNG|nr:hypothetical protein DM01DRAFT_1404648 [Hesseltinella vesiculosa]